MDDSGDEISVDSQEDEDWMDEGWAQPVSCGPAVTDRRTLDVTGAAAPSSSSTHVSLSEKGVSGDNMVKRMLLNDNKAGMEGLDKEKINQIIFEASKGSKFYENEKKKEEQMKKRINEQMQKKSSISDAQFQRGVLEADRLLEDFEQQRDLGHTIVHIDMDAFYAAVEMRDKPELKNKPMAVGGTDMLSTSNYHARKFGVRAAMPGFIAKKLCPQLVIVSLNFDKYRDVSKQVRSIMAEYDPNFCPMSLDEAYLDITEHLEARQKLTEHERTLICRDAKFVDSKSHCLCDLNEVVKDYGDTTVAIGDKSVKLKDYFQSKATVIVNCDTEQSAEDEKGAGMDTAEGQVTVVTEDKKGAGMDTVGGQITAVCPNCGKEFPPFVLDMFGLSDVEAVREMRMKIEQRTRLTASAGIAPNMMLAKVSSDKNKPNGQYKVPATVQAVMDFVRNLPTRKISGIGKVSEAMLNALDVYTCQDLYDKRGLLYHLYSTISFNYFMRICIGIGSTTVERDSERKSISTERTFSELSKPAELYEKCEELCGSLVEDLEEEHLKGKTVSIKIKTIKFEVKTRAHSLPTYSRDRNMIFQAACDLLRTEIQLCAPQPLRLRLMGVRMSGLVHESLCRDSKQNTILTAFKKMTDKLSGTREVLQANCKQSLPTLPHFESFNESIVNVQSHPTCSGERVDLGTDIIKPADEEVNTRAQIPKLVEDTGGAIPKCVATETTACVNGLTAIDVDTNCNVLEVTSVDRRVSTSIEKEIDNHTSEPHRTLDEKASSSCNPKQEQLLKVTVQSLTDHGCIEMEDCPESQVSGANRLKRPIQIEETDYINGSDSIDSWEGECKREITQSKNQSSESKYQSIESTKQSTEDTNQSNESINQSTKSINQIKQGENHSSSVLGDVRESRMTSISSALAGAVSSKDTNPKTTNLIGVRATRSGLVRKANVSKRKSKGKLKYTCPICSREIFCSNLSEFNAHVDDCLEGYDNAELGTNTSTECPLTASGCSVSQISDCDILIIEDVKDDQYSDTTVHKPDETTGVEFGEENAKVTENCGNHPIEYTLDKEDTVSETDQNSCDIITNNKCQSSNTLNQNGDQIITCNNSVTEPDVCRELPPDSQELPGVHSASDCCSYEITLVNGKSIVDGVLNRDSGSGNDLVTVEPAHVECNVSGENTESHNFSSMGIQSVKYGGICKSTAQGGNVSDVINEDNIDDVLGKDGIIDEMDKKNVGDELYNKGDGLKEDNTCDEMNEDYIRDEMNADNIGDEIYEDNIGELNADNIGELNADNIGELNADNIGGEINADNGGDELDAYSSLLVCPVCNVEQRSCNLADFNSHVDLCLSRGTISNILREDRSKDASKIKRSHSSTISASQSSKRRKTTAHGEAPTSRSILSFFKGSGESS